MADGNQDLNETLDHLLQFARANNLSIPEDLAVAPPIPTPKPIAVVEAPPPESHF